MRIISRSDDYGSARAANRAIIEALDFGCITRNVSVMAPGPYLAEAAEALKKYKHIAIGMHATLNSEWEGIRWGAFTDGVKKAGLTYADGTFFKSSKELEEVKNADIDAILFEYQAQLDYITRLGLKVDYVDSHMFPEYQIKELFEPFNAWIKSKGLLSAQDYYIFADPMVPKRDDDFDTYKNNVKEWFLSLKKDQTFYLTHPAKSDDEMLLLYNENIPKGDMMLERSFEHRIVTSAEIAKLFEQQEIVPIKYTEAVKVNE